MRIAVAFAAGAYLGAAAVRHIPAELLRLCFGFLMLYIAIRFIVSSNSEVTHAAAGLVAVAVAWVAYLGLRVLGRRHQHRPDLGQHIRTAEEQGRGDADYYI